ncbi:MAG TPA: methyltransferase [Candidatus Paceibacterota bacterium]|nr:methyltransferase [Candidatus Paceibacterota bacterium]
MSGKEKLVEFLKNPVVDKVLGALNIVVSLYILYVFYLSVVAGTATIYSAAIAANMAVIVVTTMIRRTAKRVSINPIFWIFTFLRNYWVYVVLSTVYVFSTAPVLPQIYTNMLLLLGVGIIVYSRLSLGRNIGFIPARRELVTTGAYGMARHPIHTGELVFIISYMLAGFTPLNFFLLSLGFIFIIVKSLIEESFLKDDQDYQEYCKKVPYRWIPGII